MSLQRGDVVIVDFPQQTGPIPKRRPAVVVQCDTNNRRLSNSIFAMVTSNTQLAQSEPTQILIEVATEEGKFSGLLRNSAVKCENLYTLPISAVRHTIGRLSPAHLRQLDGALKAALALR